MEVWYVIISTDFYLITMCYTYISNVFSFCDVIGQFGPISFSAAALISFLIATLISVLDSIGDYYACARVCRVPAPPSHAVNR